ncbi:oligoendopeptidase F [Catenibacillus scindens]|uniref:Oligopeptidase F n=1 Tax=Catenibacillus scindens TaxID=673271 RepID=A0A7W8M3Z9_9FIRM|nr:oligoendopeptidase F [Catenibacillus scindens]MBB5263319.1 oligoendopeptidase F [Catenibacillus scindens]
MSDATKILLRSEVDPKDTWAIEDLFPSDEAWEEAVKQLQAQTDEIVKYQGKLGDSAQSLYGYCALETQINENIENIYGYANRQYDVDTTNSTYQAMMSRATSIYVDCVGRLSFSSPEILAIPDDILEQFFKDEPRLSIYRRSIMEIRRLKDHILSPAEEKLLAAAGEVANGPETIFSMMDNADAVFPPVIDDDGKELPLTHGSFISLMENSNRRIRRDAFMNLYHTLEGHKNTSAAVLAAQVNQLKFFAQARKYPSTIEAALNVTNVPVSVYKNLINTVHDNMGYMYKYMKLRKKLLGLDELHMYDLYTSMVPDADVKITFEEAKKNVMEAVAVLGKDYQAILKEGFDNRWIDVYENKGKRSGAYSAGHKVHPFVLLNHKDTLNSEFTLAHEMGHAIHSWLSNKNQPAPDAEYVIFVAEVASTCNEALLMQYLLKNTEDKKVRAYLINYFLEQFRTTLYRQTMFAEFEMKINEASEQGVGLTADYLNKLYHDLNVLYYGEDVVVDREIDMEWARIPHFFYNFYVFQYATGFSAAIALSQRILKEGEPAVKDYISFLSGGCSKDPISLLRGAGVDMESPKPIEEALKLFSSLIDEMEELM